MVLAHVVYPVGLSLAAKPSHMLSDLSISHANIHLPHVEIPAVNTDNNEDQNYERNSKDHFIST